MHVCYHHTDMDGKAAANEVYHYWKQRGDIDIKPEMFIGKQPASPYYEEDYIGEHGGKEVIIVDLSFNKDTIHYIFDMLDKGCSVTWIDHHATSLELFDDPKIGPKLRDYNSKCIFKYIINIGACGALLSHLYFHDGIMFDDYDEILRAKIGYLGMSPNRTAHEMFTVDTTHHFRVTDVPEYLYLIDLWDRWAFGKSKKPEYLNYAFNATRNNIFIYKDKDPTEKVYNEKLWDKLLSTDTLNAMIRNGKIIKDYMEQRNTSAMNRAYEATIEGKKAIVLNASGNSLIFGDKASEYDISCLWVYDGKTRKFRYSLYSSNEDIDVSKIAEKFGGGGHRGAAGFESETLIF